MIINFVEEKTVCIEPENKKVLYKQYQNDYYKRNKERYKGYYKKYYEKNKKKIKERNALKKKIINEYIQLKLKFKINL